MKRIIICCDGTWNWPDKDQNGIPTATNVVKLAEAIRPEDSYRVRQVMYYDPGIGSSGNYLDRVIDGVTGKGLSRNVLEAYRFLIGAYELGDELFFFGFSRGAFTVRSLLGLIRTCSILRPDSAHMVDHAFAIYRTRRHAPHAAAPGKGAAGPRPSPVAPTHPEGREAWLFRRTYAVDSWVPVKCIGVWDTVGALGNPLLPNGLLSRRYHFHDTSLSSIVENAFHALAIDEKRRTFEATLWRQQAHAQGQTLEQVWFVGAHSNIGGGYPNPGLSDYALEWMASRAADCGLALESLELRPDPKEPPAESRKHIFKLVPKHYRPIDQPQARRKQPELRPTNETLHPSVVERYRNDPSYRPKNLVKYFREHPDLRPS